MQVYRKIKIKNMYKVTVNGNSKFEINQEKESFFVDNDKTDWDLVKISENKFHIIKNNKSYNAELIKFDTETKTFDIKVNGKIHQVNVKDRMDILLDKMGLGNAKGKKINEIKAPMPGLIVDIKVEVGAEVKKGDALMILEAMKMENILKSPGDGVVKTIKVEKKQSVEKNQVLIVFN
jgi:biotin carboxyl carrier protein